MRLGAKQPERRRPLLIYNFGFSGRCAVPTSTRLVFTDQSSSPFASLVLAAGSAVNLF